MAFYEWIELGGLAAIILLLLDIHTHLREISHRLKLLQTPQ